VYGRSAAIYDALYDFKDYEGAVREIRRVLDERAPGARSVLDVGCGTGRQLELLAERYETAGIDISPGMLEVARHRCPDTSFSVEDMASFDLGRTFDVVLCLFSAIGYVRTVERLQSAVAAMARHLEPGGLLLIEPWFTPEAFWTGTITFNQVDQPDLKIAWMYTSEREGEVSVLDIHYLVGRPSGIESFRERHELGLFTEQQHVEAFRAAGLTAQLEPEGPFGRGLYVAADTRVP
jgi:ubiquinone/menaquinone biosynthesis C-methylase UbiE